VNEQTQTKADHAPYTVRAVQRTLDILDALGESPDGLSLAELAAAADVPKSSIFRYLATLQARGYVERDRARGRFLLDRRLQPARSLRLERLARLARPHLQALRDRFEETVNLGVLDGTRVGYLQIVESPWTMRLAAREGDRDPIHSTALGKAIASQLRLDHVLRVLDAEGMPRLTARTITRPDDFLRELEDVRRRGFAFDHGENEEGGNCVAVPLPLSPIRAAISLSAPAVRLGREREEPVAAALMETAQRLAEHVVRDDA
jgi:IclR family transcriptional regulator, acetate operon repressor